MKKIRKIRILNLCRTLTVTITFTLSEIIVLRPRSMPANSVSSPSTYPVGGYEQFRQALT